jgi:filamentous hemagglutinin family protein
MNRIIFFVIICALLNISAYADGTHPQGIRLDGSVGTAGKVELPGPDYQIKPEYGKQSGANLFHSFQQFNIHSGESATFSGPASVKNIISRVTGGSASWIDGKLASAIPGADLYFLNPFGVMFGSSASLDLSGSFHVSTADYLKMGDNERFHSKPIENEVLSVAAPTAFGFLSEHPAAISAQGSFLSVPTGKTVSFIGGDIAFHNATLAAQEGRVNLASAASAGEIRLSDTRIEMNGIEQQGTIAITRDTDFKKITGTDYSWADITAAGINTGGEILIRAGRFELRGGAFAANIFGNGNGKEINISVTDDMIVNGAGINLGGRILNSTYGAGNAGDIAIEAKNLTLDNRAEIAAETYGTGKGGDIRLNVSTLNISNVSDISSGSGGVGQGGNISVSAADSVRVSGMSEAGHSGIYAAALNNGAGGKISVDTPDLALDKGGVISANTLGDGNAGEIRLNADNLTLTEKGAVTADTFGAGHGGHINISAQDAVSISGSKSGIIANTYSGGGDGGSISLKTSALAMDDQSIISARTAGNGNSGDINLNLDKLVLSGGAEISTETIGSGNSGSISISAKDSVRISGLADKHIGGIYANTYRGGNGGNILINTPSLSVDEEGKISSEAGGNGDAGEIRLNLTQLMLTDKGAISTDTFGSGHGGHINILAKNCVNISGSLSGIYADTSGGEGGKITIKTPVLDINDGGVISVSAKGDQKAGEIALELNTLTMSSSGEILAAASGTGQGGNVYITAADSVKISGVNDTGYKSGVYTSTFSGTGNAGNIMISASDVSVGKDGVISAFSSGKGNAGEINLNVKTLSLTDNAEISTEVIGQGNGNNINIAAENSVHISGYLSGIYTNTYGAGISGNITLSAYNMTLDEKSSISAVTAGTGKAGEIRLNINTLTLTQGSGMSTSSLGSGDGNNILLNVSDLTMKNGSYIEAFSNDTGNAGNIILDAHNTVRLDNSSFLTGSRNSDGGDMKFHIDKILYLSDSYISTSAKGGTGSGGNISIDPQFVILNNSNITANAYGGRGGNIHIVADNFIRSWKSIVDASSKLGIDGLVEINSPDADISSGLMVLSGSFFDVSRWAATPCEEKTDEPTSRFFIRRYIVQPVPFEEQF